MVILRNGGARSAPRISPGCLIYFTKILGFYYIPLQKNPQPRAGDCFRLAAVLSICTYLYCLLSAILPLSSPQLLCGARSGMRAAQWPGGRAVRGRARASAARRPNLVQASVEAVRQLVALRRCGTVALRRCGTVALRRCGVS